VSDETTPLDILLAVMRERFASRDFDAAVAIAKAVAPFVHPKPRARTIGASIDTLRDQQLVELCRSGEAGAGASEEDTR
jgi:hypothetical protein